MAVEASSLFQRFSQISQMPLARQLTLLVGLAVSIALGMAILQWVRQPDFTPLYGELAPNEVTEIIQALEQSGTPYSLDNRTGLISVPAEEVYQARLRLASEGLPRGNGQGFDMLYQPQELGLSSFMEKARYDRALEQELGRTVTAIESVKSARVHLAIPKATGFIRQESKPEASVLVDLYPGRDLTDRQLAGIRHMVAASVPELEVEHVAVVDSKGRLLSESDQDGDFIYSAQQFSITQKIEQNYVDRIHQILTPILGSNGVRAQVTADMDFTVVESTSETYSPETKIRSEQLVQEQSNTSTSSSGGVPGTLSNQPPDAASLALSAQGDDTGAQTDVGAGRTSSTEVRNFELDRTISHIREAPGSVKRLSVAVVLDYRTAVNAEGVVESQPISAEELDRITALVKEAVGFDELRGDRINVVNASFMPTDPLEPFAEPSLLDQDWVWRSSRILLGGLAFLFLIFAVVRPIMKASALSGNVASNPAYPGVSHTSSGQVALGHGPMMAEDQVTLSGQPLSGQQRELPGTPTYQQQLAMARTMVDQEPARVAHVVKNWVVQDG